MVLTVISIENQLASFLQASLIPRLLNPLGFTAASTTPGSIASYFPSISFLREKMKPHLLILLEQEQRYPFCPFKMYY